MLSRQPIEIAVLQTVSGPVVADNLAVAGELIAEAAGAGACLLALPEFFALISGDENAKLCACERDGAGPIQDFLCEAAARHKVWIVGGTLPLASGAPDKVRNTVLVYDDRGGRVARYDKIHLFGFTRGDERYDEANTIEAGDRVVCFDSPAGRVGLAVCYDLRFPEFFRAMDEVDLIVLPAAFTYTTGQAHWETLLRARAIENQCYLMAAAQGGRHPHGRRTWGHSMIVDPWGEVLACRAEGPGVVSATLDPARIADIRQSLPALRHRRPEVMTTDSLMDIR
ncbi:MAG: carbon-nitrogen hydrolase family protein [Azoarcus sp.]|jgi:nitrilase|nr:carbon-nitrogen hydrolase family protein [Azoarcus sp.]